MIVTNTSDRQTPHFRVLTDAQCHELYLSALECLNRVGVQVNHPEAVDLLAQAGAAVRENIVYIPPHIIQDALVSVPRTFTFWGRGWEHEIQVRPNHVHFGPGPTCTYFMDPYTGQRRKSRRGDAALVAQVVDALPNLDYVMGLSLFDDVTPVLSPVYEFAETIAQTTKPVVAWSNTPETAQDIYDIAALVAGSQEALQRRPIYALFTTYESPLRNPKEGLGNILWAVEHGIPVIYLGGPTVGLESPFSSASSLVIYLATALSGVAVAQLKRRGSPVAIGSVLSAMDLRSARPAYGSPEGSLNIAAAVELAHYLGVPFMGTAGASESKLPDGQAGMEIMLHLLTSALSGPSLVHDVGFLDCADIGSLDLLVMANEALGMVGRMMRGVVVNQDTIMMDLIEKVGPGGSFLTEPRSAALCRPETWVPGLLDRNPYLSWENKGSQGMEQRLRQRVLKILESHQAKPLPEDVAEGIDAVLRRAEMREASLQEK